MAYGAATALATVSPLADRGRLGTHLCARPIPAMASVCRDHRHRRGHRCGPMGTARGRFCEPGGVPGNLTDHVDDRPVAMHIADGPGARAKRFDGSVLWRVDV